MELFPSEAVNTVAPVPRVHRAATQMSAMDLCRPPVGPVVPGPMPGYSSVRTVCLSFRESQDKDWHCHIYMNIPKFRGLYDINGLIVL